MRPIWRTLTCALGAGGLLLGALTAGQGVASASVSQLGVQVCSGTAASPGQLVGTYDNLEIIGQCNVQNGPVTVYGNLQVAPNAALNAVFGLDNSRLTVDGNLFVQNNASVMLGCDTVFVTLWGTDSSFLTPEFPCIDDPNQNAPTLTSHDVIRGNLIATNPLGVVLHNTAVSGNVSQNGGGGGNNCINQGIFNEDIGFPQYSGYFDGSIGGNLSITNLATCWFGSFRMNIGGSMINENDVNNDPDGNEIETNVIHGSFICTNDDSPAVQWGDGNGVPNEVGGAAIGECGFNVLVPNPAPEAGVEGVTPVLVHVSVPLHRGLLP
jgi:hypothetical protein